MSPGKRRLFALIATTTLATTALAVPAAAQEDVPQGGTLIVGEWQVAEQLNPLLTNALKDFEAIRPAQRPLAGVNDAGEFVPELLTEFPSVENGGIVPDEDGAGFTMNLKLQDGLKWSDGEPLTLEDYKQNYDWAVATGMAGVACPYCSQLVPLIDSDPALSPELRWAPENQRVDSFTVSEDGLSAEIHFAENFAGWITMLTEIHLIAPQYWMDVPTDELATRMVVGADTLLDIPTNGPFKYAASSADGIDYVPNEYWTADSGPNLEQLRLRFYPDNKPGMITAFLAGDLDLTLNTTLADVAALQVVDPSIGRSHRRHGLAVRAPRLQLRACQPRPRRPGGPPGAGHGHRQADAARRPLPGRRAHAGLLDRAAGAVVRHRDRVRSVSIRPPPRRSSTRPAGRSTRTTGERTKDGNVMRLHACTSSGNPVRLTTLGRIAQDLLAIGVAVDIETSSEIFTTYDLSTAETAVQHLSRHVRPVPLHRPAEPGPVQRLVRQVPLQPGGHGCQSRVVSTSRASLMRTMDELIAKLQGSMTEEEIKAVAAEIQQYVNDITTEVALYYRPEPSGVSNHLGGFEKKNPSTATSLWDVENWYFIP